MIWNPPGAADRPAHRYQAAYCRFNRVAQCYLHQVLLHESRRTTYFIVRLFF
jgi:hypothetical protein